MAYACIGDDMMVLPLHKWERVYMMRLYAIVWVCVGERYDRISSKRTNETNEMKSFTEGIGGAVVQNIHDIITLANYICRTITKQMCITQTAYVAVCVYILCMCVEVRPYRAVCSYKYIAIFYWASAIDTVVRRNICARMSKSATHFSHGKYCVNWKYVNVCVELANVCSPTHDIKIRLVYACAWMFE